MKKKTKKNIKIAWTKKLKYFKDKRIYSQYLKSRAWKNKRQRVIARAKGICEECRVNKIAQVHHLTYKHIGDEQLNELMGLCKECHEAKHKKCVYLLLIYNNNGIINNDDIKVFLSYRKATRYKNTVVLNKDETIKINKNYIL